MKKSSFSKHSESDRDFLHNARDEDIDLSDIPEITEEQIARAVMRVGGKPVPEGKVRVNMYLDADQVELHQAKERFLELVGLAAGGEEVIIARDK